MIPLRDPAHPCDHDLFPSREGYLILGACPVRSVPVPEPCPEGPADPSFGILPCRCVRSKWRTVEVDSESGSLPPHDVIRLNASIEVICKL